jgi:hypothetical protein
VELEGNNTADLKKHSEYSKMNRKVTVIFLSTVLPAALIAGQNGLSPKILERASSIKTDSAALRGAIAGPQGMLEATGSSATAAAMNNIRAGLLVDKFSGANRLTTDNQAGLDTFPSSGSAANATVALMDNNRAGLMAGKFSSAASLMTDNQAGLNSSLPSGATARETAALMDNNRAGLTADKFSGAASQMANVTSDLRSSLSSNLSKQESEQMQNSQLPASLVQ